MNYSVAILSKNPSNLRNCLNVLLYKQPNLTRDRIIVVDDGLGEVGFDSYFTRVKGESPFVFSRNANIGIRAPGGQVEVTTHSSTAPEFISILGGGVILLNDDASLETVNGFDELARVAAANPEYGLISPATNNVGNKNQNSQGATFLREDPRMVCFVCVYIPRTTFDLVGPLDEQFCGYGYEDDDYCQRVRNAGLKIGIWDGVKVDHSRLPSTFRSEAYPTAAFEQNRQVYIGKWGSHG